MKFKKLLILVAAAAVLGTVAHITTKKRSDSRTPEKLGKQIFSDLQIDNVASIKLKQGDKAITLEKKDNGWSCPEKYDYSVKEKKVNELLLTVAGMKAGQMITADDSQKKKMRVKLTGDRDSGTSVVFIGADGTSMASLIVGEPRMAKRQQSPMGMPSAPEGTYISTDKGETVTLVSDDIQLKASPTSWLNSELINVPEGNIEKVSIVPPEGTPFVFIKNEEGTLEFQDLKRKEITVPQKAYSLSKALVDLIFADVADPSLTAEQTGLDKPIIHQATTSDGKVYSIAIGKSVKSKPQKYIAIKVGLVPEKEEETNDKDLTPEEKAKAEKDKQAAKEERQAKLKAAREENARLSKWIFTIPTYRSDELVTSREEAVTKKPKEKKDKEK